MRWENELSRVLNSWAANSIGVVLSPDVDGLLSCAILASKFPVKVIGIYTTSYLVLLDNSTPVDAANALWLDHDISEPGIRCVGQHLVHHRKTNVLPRREKDSFNPNVRKRQSWENSFRGRSGLGIDKYPFGTAHFLAHAFEIDPGHSNTELAALLAHADGTWRTVIDYQANADIWHQLMFEGNSFLSNLRNTWAKSTSHLNAHSKVVENLVSRGVARTPSRAKIASLLPENLRALTGSQSVHFNSRNPQTSLESLNRVLGYISSQVGTKPRVGLKSTSIITGKVETPDPLSISNFDDFMMENQIFSHAFTDLKTLRYTKGIMLRKYLD
jgi:hypothetical protein